MRGSRRACNSSARRRLLPLRPPFRTWRRPASPCLHRLRLGPGMSCGTARSPPEVKNLAARVCLSWLSPSSTTYILQCLSLHLQLQLTRKSTSQLYRGLYHALGCCVVVQYVKTFSTHGGVVVRTTVGVSRPRNQIAEATRCVCSPRENARRAWRWRTKEVRATTAAAASTQVQESRRRLLAAQRAFTTSKSVCRPTVYGRMSS